MIPCLPLSICVALSPCLSRFHNSAVERMHFGRAEGKAKVILTCVFSATYTFKGDKQILRYILYHATLPLYLFYFSHICLTVKYSLLCFPSCPPTCLHLVHLLFLMALPHYSRGPRVWPLLEVTMDRVLEHYPYSEPTPRGHHSPPKHKQHGLVV